MSFDRLIVSIQNLKDNSEIEGNVEPALLRKAALRAQRIELRGVLGAALCDHYLDKIDSTGAPTGLTAVEQTFYDEYVTPLQAAYTEARLIYSIHYKISNAGVTVTKGTNTDPATDEAVKVRYNQAMNSADFLAQRAKKYIIDNASLYSIYTSNEQNINPQHKVQNGGIYTPYRGGDDCCPLNLS